MHFEKQNQKNLAVGSFLEMCLSLHYTRKAVCEFQNLAKVSKHRQNGYRSFLSFWMISYFKHYAVFYNVLR